MKHQYLYYHLQRSGRFVKSLEGEPDGPVGWEELREQARLLVDLYRAVPQLYSREETLELVSAIQRLLGRREGEKAAKRLLCLS